MKTLKIYLRTDKEILISLKIEVLKTNELPKKLVKSLKLQNPLINNIFWMTSKKSYTLSL